MHRRGLILDLSNAMPHYEAFLRDQPQTWKNWVPGDVSSRVNAGL
jgi:hypothetical protein